MRPNTSLQIIWKSLTGPFSRFLTLKRIQTVRLCLGRRDWRANGSDPLGTAWEIAAERGNSAEDALDSGPTGLSRQRADGLSASSGASLLDCPGPSGQRSSLSSRDRISEEYKVGRGSKGMGAIIQVQTRDMTKLASLRVKFGVWLEFWSSRSCEWAAPVPVMLSQTRNLDSCTKTPQNPN